MILNYLVDIATAKMNSIYKAIKMGLFKRKKLTDSNLKNLIVKCIELQKAMNEFEENHKPEQLFLKTSIDDYVSYKKDRKAYDKKYNALLKAVTKKENLLKSSLPVTNIWFITKDGKYAAGVEKNSTHLYSLKQVYYTDQPELTSRIALGTYLRDRMPRAIYPNDY